MTTLNGKRKGDQLSPEELSKAAHPKGRPCAKRTMTTGSPCRHEKHLLAARKPGRNRAGQGHQTDAAGRTKIRLGPKASAIVRGEVDLSTWDDEEILRGQKRMRNGQFPPEPSLVPYKSVQEFRRRFFSAAGALMQRNLVQATAVIVEFITDPDQDPKLRLDASKYLVDKLTGKAPVPVHMSLEGSIELSDHEAIAVRLAKHLITSTSHTTGNGASDGT